MRCNGSTKDCTARVRGDGLSVGASRGPKTSGEIESGGESGKQIPPSGYAAGCAMLLLAASGLVLILAAICGGAAGVFTWMYRAFSGGG